MAGNSFSAGIAWNAAWFRKETQGRAVGVFGAGNVGAAGTKILIGFVPGVLTAIPAAGYFGGWIPGGWRFVPALYGALLALMGLAVLTLSPTPDRAPGRGRSFRAALRPLRHQRVWRFGLYYVVVFGAYVALSGWLPKYYIDTYGIPLSTAALLTATFIVPASLLRPLGGWMADRWGARPVTYAVFIVMAAVLILLSIPSGRFIVDARAGADLVVVTYKLGLEAFAVSMFVLGCAMGLGKASVFRYVPDYFPNDVGAAGGVVGALGALGGFILPPAFGWIGRSTGVPQLAFIALLALTLWSLGWLHLTVLRFRTATEPSPLHAASRAPMKSAELAAVGKR
jgi:NNP family nitrate/nitrite transporter-like MFS transporter